LNVFNFLFIEISKIAKLQQIFTIFDDAQKHFRVFLTFRYWILIDECLVIVSVHYWILCNASTLNSFSSTCLVHWGTAI